MGILQVLRLLFRKSRILEFLTFHPCKCINIPFLNGPSIQQHSVRLHSAQKHVYYLLIFLSSHSSIHSHTIYQLIPLSSHSSIHTPTHPFHTLIICPSAHPSIHPIYPSTHTPIHLSTHTLIYPSTQTLPSIHPHTH